MDPAVGFQAFQARKLAFGLGLPAATLGAAVTFMQALYRAFESADCSLLEINPFLMTKAGALLALDAKINFDDNALYRHPEFKELRDLDEEDSLEVEASKFNLNYIKLDGGNVGCMVNGAGLAMATMDIIKLAGGAPANFLDVGGGANAEQIRNAFRILMTDVDVKAVLINIFGGILRCDVLAEGVIAAVRELNVKIPVVIRMKGNNEEKGKQMLRESGLNFATADDMKEAAKRVVAAARRCRVSVLVGKDTRLLVQGMGKHGTFHAMGCRDYGTKVVGGVTPGKGGTKVEGFPLFDSVSEAVRKTGANVSVVFVPPPGAADAIMEAADAGIPLVVCITEGIPTLDMVKAATYLKDRPTRLIGPNCPGIISPGGEVQGRDHARPHPQGRQRGRGEPERHLDLRGGGPAHRPRHRTVDLHRHRRRSHHRHQPHRRHRAVQQGPRHQGHRDDRRDRRVGRRRSGGLREEAREEAGGRLHRRADGAARDGGWATPAPSSPGARAPPTRR